MKKLLLAVTISFVMGCSQKTSDEHIAQAQQYVSEQRMDSAVVELKNAIQKEPKNAEARFKLGEVYITLRQYENAEKELNRAMEFGHPASQVIPLLSQAYKSTGAFSELSEIDHKNEGMSPEQEVEVGYFKVQSFLQLEKLDDARELVIELQDIDVDTVYSGLLDVVDKLLEEELELAITSIEGVNARFPDVAEVLKVQGQLYMRNGQADKASEVYVNYLSVYPEDIQIKFLLANMMIENGQTEAAEPYIDQLLELNAENPLLNQLKSIVSASKNEHSDAQLYAEKAIQSGRGDPTLRMIAGYAAYMQKDYEAANLHLSFIQSALPSEHPALKMLAASQLELGLSTEASGVLDKFGDITEQDAPLFSKAGYELIRSGNLNEAREVVEKSAGVSNSPEDLTRLGILRLTLNDVSGILDLERALEQNPDLQVTRGTLANAYLSTGRFDDALNIANEWKVNEPDNFRGYMVAAEVYVKQSKYEDAINEYNQALQKDPENGLIQLAIANVDILQENTAQAHEKLEAILAKKPDFVPALATYYMSKRSTDSAGPAIAKIEQAHANNPDNQLLTILTSRMYLTEGRTEDVLTTLEGITEGADTPAGYWSVKGKALLAKGVVSDAELHYDGWLNVAPNNKEANIGKMLIHDARGSFTEGAQLSRAFLDVRDDLSVQVLHAHFLVMAGMMEDAKIAIAALPDSVKELPVANGFNARILLSEQKYDEALPLSQSVYDNIPNNRNLQMLVFNLERTKQSQKSLQIIETHLANNPNDVGAQMMLAERQISDDQSKAIATYEQTLANSPNNFIVLNNLAYLYTEAGRYSQAEELARKAVEQRPNNSDAVDTLAQALYKQDKFDEALTFYERVINDDMKNNVIYLNYVEALFASGNKNLATRKLDERNFEDAADKQRVFELRQQYTL